MLKQRIITALILLPAVLALLFTVRLDYFAALILIVVYLMSLEWAKLSGLTQPVYRSFFALTVSFINLGLWYLGDSLMVWPSLSWPHFIQPDLPLVFLFSSLFFILLAILAVLSFSINRKWWQFTTLKGLFGLVLLPAFFISFVSIRSVGYVNETQIYGGSLLLFMLMLIWGADTGAFIAGKLLGKHKLTKVSPNKTWEGLIGGLLLSSAFGWFGISILNFQVTNLFVYLSVIFLLAIISVFGDLFESALKRVANIKDSGQLLPGHGGLLDRLDSTVTVAPVFYLSFSYFEWFNG